MISNPCVKTGCNAYMTSHGGYLHGDIFYLEGVYYLRFVGGVQYGCTPEQCDFVIDNENLPAEICLMVGNTLLISQRYVTRCGGTNMTVLAIVFFILAVVCGLLANKQQQDNNPKGVVWGACCIVSAMAMVFCIIKVIT